MSTSKNINKLLDKSFKNFNQLPQKLFLEDIDGGVSNFLKSIDISLVNDENKAIKPPIVFLSQERWAEFKLNWRGLRDESNEEMTMPFGTLGRKSVKQGTSPLKRTIPKRKKFTFLKVPIFDGTLKGYELYKMPQPVWVDLEYELRFLTHYMQDVNKIYEKILDSFADLQGYININGYYLPIKLEGPNEENTTDDVNADRKFHLVFPLTVYGKIVDPNNFEKVNTITKVIIDITEMP